MVKIRLAALVTVTLVSTLLSDVARAQPSTGDAHFRKGLDYASDGNFEQARDEFVRALKLAPVSSVAAAGVQQSLRLIERLGRGENKAAAMALYRGLRLVNADAPDKAIDEFNRALSIQRNLHEARSLRGAAYTAVGRYQEGLADLSKAIEDDPTDVWALVNRSMAYVLGTHEYNLAVADCDRALELLSPRDPMRALVHLNRGRARSENRDYMGAESDYTAALALDANLVYAYVNRAGIYYKTRRYDEALADYNKALQIQPETGEAYAGRAVVYYFKEDFTRARQDVQAAKQRGAYVHPGFLEALGNAPSGQR